MSVTDNYDDWFSEFLREANFMGFHISPIDKDRYYSYWEDRVSPREAAKEELAEFLPKDFLD